MLKRNVFLKVVFILIATQSSALAEVIRSIKISGNERVSDQTVLAYLPIAIGDNVTSADMNKVFKGLYKSNMFADIKMNLANNVLHVRVVERAIINVISYEGNRKIKDKAIKADSLLRPRMPLNNSTIQEEKQRIATLYKRQGRYAAQITPQVIKRDQNRADVVFEIAEGAKTVVRKIIFTGNNKFSDRRLRKVLSTKEWKLLRFWASDDIYDPDRIEYDKELLRQFYMNEGYVDFRMISNIAELSDNLERFFVTFVIEEGQQYKVSEIHVDSKIEGFDEKEMLSKVVMKKGKKYSLKDMEESVTALTEFVGMRGYAFVEINPRVRRNANDKTVNIVFEINEAPKAYIRRVDLSGNTVTLDHVIRRELAVAEGDPFNTAMIQKSQRNVRNLGFFKTAEITSEKGDKDDEVVVKVEVQEQSTGEISLSGGFSSMDGPLVEFGFTQRNFRGRGQEISGKAVMAKRRRSLLAEFVEPSLFNRDLSGGVSLFYSEVKNDIQSSYDEISYGSTLSSGYNLSDSWSQHWSYTLEQSDITKIRSNASRFIRAQAGTSTVSAVGHSIMYDKRDYRFEPTSGYYVTLINRLAGLGGNIRYLRNTLIGVGYYSPFKNVVMALKLHGGVIFDLGQDTRVVDRFSLGGDSLRGFDFSGIGPRDITGNFDSLGGLKYYAATLETSFPLGLPSEYGVKGAVFCDAGTLWDAQQKNPIIMDDRKMRVSAGVGISWRSPFGPLRIDFAKPIVKHRNDQVREILIGFRTNL